MKKGWIIGLAILFLALTGGGFYVWQANRHTEFISPLGTGEILSAATSKLSGNTIIGFLPYWTLSKEVNVDLGVLDQVIYFGLGIGADGEIIQREKDYVEPGWRWFNSENLAEIKTMVHQKNKKILFSANCFDNETIDRVLRSAAIRRRLITNLVSLVKNNGFDGVNIDFEYTYDPDGSYPEKEHYSLFLADLKQALIEADPEYLLSADFYSNAVVHDNVYDIRAAGQTLDHFIIMAYDYYRASSDTSGPVAPLRSDYGKSITEVMQAAFTKIPKEKIVLGIPLYGYQWETYSGEPGSFTIPRTGMMASYDYVHTLIEEKDLEIHWNKEAMSPYLIFSDSGQTVQIYYENLESLSLKYQLVRQLAIGGVAFWAVGYEGDYQEVWHEAGQKLKT